MDSENKPLDKPSDAVTKKSDLINNSLEDSVTDIAFQALITSQQYKQDRMDMIRLFERMYYNDIPPQFRQTNNAIAPIFGGLVDGVLADLNDDMHGKFQSRKASDYLSLPKIQALWEEERDSLEPNAQWNKKGREDRFNSVLSGRRIMLNYAESDPEYRNVQEVINYTDFHCQPFGGSELENHMFCGREGILRTIESIYEDESYPEKQRQKIKDFSLTTEVMTQIETDYGTKLQRFTSMRQDPVSNGYTGDPLISLCRFFVTFKGARYTVLFEPLSKTWLKVEQWINNKGVTKNYPFYSSATHEDHKLFWSKGFADDFYRISEIVIVLIQQEITNREKMNNQSRAVDPLVFPDLAALDAAQYEPGRIVPFKSITGIDGNVRRASDSVFEFTTPQLQGTIQLSQELLGMLKDSTGAGELIPPKGAKPGVIVALQQQRSRRIALRSDGMQEMQAKLMLSWYEGLVENMPAKMSVKILGENGFLDEQEITRSEISDMGKITCKIISTSEQESADNLKRDGRLKAIEMITNPKLQLNAFEKETILRDIGQFDETQISFMVENVPYTAKKQVAHASKALQILFLSKSAEEADKQTPIYYGADATYQKYFYNWIVDNKDKLGKKFPRFFAHLKKMQPIFEQNAQMQGQKQNQQNIVAQAKQNPKGAPEANKSTVKPGIPSSMGAAAQHQGQVVAGQEQQ